MATSLHACDGGCTTVAGSCAWRIEQSSRYVQESPPVERSAVERTCSNCVPATDPCSRSSCICSSAAGSSPGSVCARLILLQTAAERKTNRIDIHRTFDGCSPKAAGVPAPGGYLFRFVLNRCFGVSIVQISVQIPWPPTARTMAQLTSIERVTVEFASRTIAAA